MGLQHQLKLFVGSIMMLPLIPLIKYTTRGEYSKLYKFLEVRLGLEYVMVV
ncbi:hypothetical protein [Aeromonas phage Akh-2]|nr:hypothetical protein [Aeromonas phage Akh-2]